MVVKISDQVDLITEKEVGVNKGKEGLIITIIIIIIIIIIIETDIKTMEVDTKIIMTLMIMKRVENSIIEEICGKRTKLMIMKSKGIRMIKITIINLK